MRFLILCVAITMATVPLWGQSMWVSDIDVTGYPTITAKVVIHDRDGNPVRAVLPSDLQLLVDGAPVPVQMLECPPVEQKQAAHIVLVSDKSLSMELPITGTLDEPRIQLVTLGVSTFINAIDFGVAGTEIALTTFDTSAYLLQFFTQSTIELNSRAGAITPFHLPGTNYTAAFFHPDAGAIPLLKRSPPFVKRVIVFLTDGAPTVPFNAGSVLAEAVAEHIAIYPITLDVPMTGQLQEIADATGGVAFSNVRTRAEIVSIYKHIARQSQSAEPCTIRWQAALCSPVNPHRVTVSYPALPVSASFVYDVRKYQVLPTVSTRPDTTLCAGDGVQLQAKGSDSDGSYQWYPMEGLSNAFIANPIATPTTTTTYTVFYTDGKGCSTSADVRIRVVRPVLTVESDTVHICKGSSVRLYSRGSGSFFSWKPTTDLNNPSIASPIATPATTTTYYVRMKDEVCTVLDSVTVVVVDPAKDFDAGPDTALCLGSSLVFSPASVEGQYQWSPPDGLDNARVLRPVASPLTTTRYTLTVTTASGCTMRDSLTVTVYPPPVVDAGENTHICLGANTILRAAGGEGAWHWSPSDGLSAVDKAVVTAMPTTTTTYTVVFTDEHGCTGSDSVTVVVGKTLLVDAGRDTSICIGGEVQLRATGGEGLYEWTPVAGIDNPHSSAPRAKPSQTTTYTVKIITPDGCFGSDSITVDVRPLPAVDAGGPIALCRGEKTVLSAIGSEGVYQWSPVVGLDNPLLRTPVASPSVSTMYTVTVSNENGCQSTDSVLVAVRLPSTLNFSLRNIPTQPMQVGEPISMTLYADGLDATEDSIASFTSVLTYDMNSLQYKAFSIVPVAATANWNFTAAEDKRAGTLTIQGAGKVLPNGALCTFVMTPFLSAQTAAQNTITLDFSSVSFLPDNGCITWEAPKATIVIEPSCSGNLRAVRYSTESYKLEQNMPNPAQGNISITYSIGLDGFTSLLLYNTFGEKVATIVNEQQRAGVHRAQCTTAHLPSGLYYYRLSSGPYTATQQLLITK